MRTIVALKAHLRTSGLKPVLGYVDSKEWARLSPAEFLDVVWQDQSSAVRIRKDELAAIDPSPISEPNPFGEAMAALDNRLTERAGKFRVDGVGPDAEMMTHANGAKESKAGFATTSLPPKALLAVAAVQKHGDDKYGVDNWRDVPILDHLNHAQIHYLAFMAGDKSDKHLEHYATRALMALELLLEEKGVVG